MPNDRSLPPGQRALQEFPSFGMPRLARRLPRALGPIEVEIVGSLSRRATISNEWSQLPRTTQRSDFHCVTTWSHRSLEWSGVRFRDFFELAITPLSPRPGTSFVVLHCRDGYRSALPLEDLLASEVLLADTLNGAPLPIEHGAPMRLIAPAHYGYKNAKHIHRIELRESRNGYRPVGPKFMEHPRARVAFEERGRGLPGWCFRYLYRPFIAPTIRSFERIRNHRTG
jgi:DMSO/TMAO reductase YedYZ molybdopterin-dependent catalytic subunit